MTPSARVQAAIELLDSIIEAARDAGPAADTIVQRYFKQRRYAGSKDRRAVRELVYGAIRRFGDRPECGRAAMLGLAAGDPELQALFDGSAHAPAPIVPGEPAATGSALPAWILPHLDPQVTDPEALLERATLDLRVNRLKATREQVLALLPQAVPTSHSPLGLRLPEGFRIEEHPAWLSGQVEIQDEGSQLVALACDARGGMTVVDLCAGAGGKTLALAAEMGNAGHILASDTDRRRLARLPQRLQRAGADIVENLLLDPGRETELFGDRRADLLLVDAPCSGSGTWRRNPETRWRLDATRLERLVALQAYLLDVAAHLVRPGGHLTYAVCSVVIDEGQAQADAFSARHPSFVSVDPAIEAGVPSGTGRLLIPARDRTDGFFIARWHSPC